MPEKKDVLSFLLFRYSKSGLDPPEIRCIMQRHHIVERRDICFLVLALCISKPSN